MTIFIVIFVLLMMSAFFSGSETGLTGASRAKIHKLKVEGNKRANMVSKLRKQKEQLIGAILLGNNAVNILASALATTVALEYFGDEGVFYVTIILTLLVLIFAEVLPKTYALRHAEKVALFVSPVFILLVKMLSPVTWFVQVIVDGVLNLFGANHPEASSEAEGTDALRGAIELHHDEGAVVKHDRDMLGSILDLSETEVGEIMIHRKELEMIDIAEPTANIIERVLSSRFTRLPVWEDNPDNIIGLMHSKTLMRALRNYEGPLEELDIRTQINEPWFVPETTTLKDQLQAFREKHSHFAFVIDEYGALMGAITLEDVLEEIVGQIEDENDSKISKIRKTADGSYLVDGKVTIRDINRELDWTLPDAEAVTIAGLIIHEAQLIPEIGQVFHFHDCRFEIMKKQRNQILSVKIRKG